MIYGISLCSLLCLSISARVHVVPQLFSNCNSTKLNYGDSQTEPANFKFLDPNCWFHLHTLQCRASHADFIVPYQKYVKSINSRIPIGTRFKMRFNMDDSPDRRSSNISVNARTSCDSTYFRYNRNDFFIFAGSVVLWLE